MPGLIRGVARTAVIAGTATSVSNRVSRRQAGRWAAKDQQQYEHEAYEQQQAQQYAQPQYAPPQYGSPPMQPGAPMSIEAPGTAPRPYPQQSYQSQQYPPEQSLGAPPSNLRAPPDWQRSDRQPAYDQVPSRRSVAPPPEIETEELPPYANPGAAPMTRRCCS